MKVQVLEERAIVHSAASSTSEVLSELHAGDEITLGKTIKRGGSAWVEATLPSNMTGYVSGDIKIYQIREVVLAQSSVSVVDSPAANSKIKMTYKKGDKFALVGLVTQDGTQWVKIRSDSGDVGFMPADTKIKEIVEAGMFKETDYMPFMLGVFLIGGLLGMPLTYGLGTGLSYLESLPWALASCVVFLIAFRRNGTISWGRAIPAIVAVIIGANAYNQSTRKPAFAAGGLLGFLLVMVCGYVGIGIGRIFKR